MTINSMSIRKGNADYIMTQKNNMSVSKVWFSRVDPLQNLVVLLVTQNVMQGIFCRFLNLLKSSQNICLYDMQKVQKLIINFT